MVLKFFAMFKKDDYGNTGERQHKPDRKEYEEIRSFGS